MGSLLDWLKNCEVCPNFCRIDRTKGHTGRCRSGDSLVVSAADLHFGEEPCIVGKGGSGTIFLTACNLSCVFCQNSEISRLDRGCPMSGDDFVRLMHSLALRGAENINLVSPTHQGPMLFEAVARAKRGGLRIPVVYNCGGYENTAFLRELDGLVDIYMPDFKYASNAAAAEYSGIEGYIENCTSSLKEMHRQVGDLRIDAQGVAERGLLVRHLLLPGGISGIRRVIDFLADGISRSTYLNIMDQYHPAYRAVEFAPLRRRVLRSEIDDAVLYARSKGMVRVHC
jgi:putative pyruvate formate lyase activating enzyme